MLKAVNSTIEDHITLKTRCFKMMTRKL